MIGVNDQVLNNRELDTLGFFAAGFATGLAAGFATVDWMSDQIGDPWGDLYIPGFFATGLAAGFTTVDSMGDQVGDTWGISTYQAFLQRASSQRVLQLLIAWVIKLGYLEDLCVPGFFATGFFATGFFTTVHL
jgi:hypothetical protein